MRTPYRRARISLSSLALNCDILDHRWRRLVPAGALTIRGYGMAGDGRSVERVDISVDDGLTWQLRPTYAAPSQWSWRPWSLTVDDDGAEGPLGITARAWDDTGALQPDAAVSLWRSRADTATTQARVALRVS